MGFSRPPVDFLDSNTVGLSSIKEQVLDDGQRSIRHNLRSPVNDGVQQVREVRPTHILDLQIHYAGQDVGIDNPPPFIRPFEPGQDLPLVVGVREFPDRDFRPRPGLLGLPFPLQALTFVGRVKTLPQLIPFLRGQFAGLGKG